jgi:hypothetical protein
MDAEKWHYLYNSFVETFVKEQYKWLSQNLKDNTTVFDFGAQAGDSSFYLLQNNENKIHEIYAYEPDPEFHNLLIENLKETGNNKIKPVFAKAPEPFKLEKEIKNIIIKCDIEGAEHSVFTKNSNLENVYKIQLEYHGGTKDLPYILKDKGFTVKITDPWTKDKILGDVGYIYAWRGD